MADAFARVLVDYVVSGGARVSWEMNRHFVDPGPYSFQLQFGRTGNQDADDWIDIGSPVVDTYFTFDLEKRLFGKEMDSFYRVELVTNEGTYYSMIAQADGKLDKRDWLFVREFIRKEQLRHRVMTSVKGYLLKARRYGPRCETCTDTYTEEVQNTNCPDCYGTGFQNGYFEPMQDVYCELQLQGNRTHRDGQTGTQKSDVLQARFVGDPQLYSYDVWIADYADERYYMHNVQQTGQHRGVNVIFTAELRLAPFTDVIYTFPITRETTAMRQTALDKKVEQWREAPKTKSKPMVFYLEAALQELKNRRKTR
jgi:hypothetical protein